MKRLLLLLFLAPCAFAQNTLVSGSITDPGGVPWFPASVIACLSPTTTDPLANNGQHLNTRPGANYCIGPAQTAADGSWSMNLVPNASITPAATQYIFTASAVGVAPPSGYGLVTVSTAATTVTGTTQTITFSGIPNLIRGGSIGTTRIVGMSDPDLQTAISNAGNGGTVIVPPGNALNLTSTIAIAHALHLTIQAHINSTADPVFALTGTGGLIFECGGDGPTGKAITDAAPTITQNTSGAKIMTVGDGVTAFRGGVIENCRFIATTNSATSTFQLNANIGDLKFRHLFISGAGFDGTAGNYTRVSFDHVRIDSAQNQAWNFQCAIGCVADWNNTYANATGGSPSIGYDLGGAGGVTGSFTNCYADSNSQAYRLKGNVRLTNIETESNTGDGINVVGGGLIVIDGYRSFSDQLPVVVNATGATVLINGLRTQSTGGANSITIAAADSIVRVNSYEQLDKAPTVSAPGKLVVTFKPGIFSTFLACTAGLEGSAGAVTDSTTATYGATITGTGANHVNGYCNGTNWVVD